jgi:zinc protease
MPVRQAVRSILAISLLVGLPAVAQVSVQPAGRPGSQPGQPGGEAPAAPLGLVPDARVTTGTLDNGLTYLVMPIENPAEGDPRGAAVRLIVDAGVLHESEGQYGTADVASEALRLRAGAEASASVDEQESVVGFDLADASTLAARLQTLAAAAAAAPSEGVLNQARTAAADDLAARPAVQRVHEQVMRRLIPSSRVVRRPAAGLAESVRAMAPQAVTDFVSRWYVASNMTLVVVAPGTADELRAMVQSAFGSLPRVPKPASPATPMNAWTPPAMPVVIEDADLDQAIVGVISAYPGREPRSVRDFRTRIIQSTGPRILQTLATTRMDKEKVPFTSASAGHQYGAEGLAWSNFLVTGDPAGWEELVAAAVTEVNRVYTHGVDPSDVSGTLIEMATHWEELSQGEPAAPASDLADMLADTRGGPSRQTELDLLLAIAGSISADDVEWEFNKRFDPSNAAVVLALPSRPGNPSEAQVNEVVQSAWNAQPEPSSELVRPWKLRPSLPEPGEVVEMTQDPDTGVWSGWLDNGVRFHVRQMAAREAGGVDVAVTIAGSELLEDASTRGFSEGLARSLDLFGMPGMAPEDIFNLFQPSGARMQVVSMPDAFRIFTSTSRAWFNPYMQRLHVLLTDSTLSPEVVARHVETIGRAQQAAQSDPSAAFNILLGQTLYKDSEVRLRPAGPEMAPRTTVESLSGWKSRVASQCPIEVAIVGDIDPQDAIEAVRFYLGSLPARPRISPDTFDALRTDVLKPLPQTGRLQMTSLGQNNTLTLFGFYMSDPEDRAETSVFRVASSILNTRLTAQAPALGMPSGGFVSTNLIDAYPGTSFFFYAIQTPGLDEAKVQDLHRTVEEQFARFAAEGPTQDELTTAVEQLATEVEQNLDATSGWWDFLAMQTYRDRSLPELTNTAVDLRGLTAERVREVFGAYFSRPDNRIAITVLPPPPDQLLEFINQPPPAPPAPPEPAPEPANPQPAEPVTDPANETPGA